MNILPDVSETIIKTDRLTLRPWKLADLDDFYEYARVDGVGQPAGWSPHESREESLGILKKFIAEKNDIAIEYGGKVIGSLGFHGYSEAELPQLASLKAVEIGFALSKNFWGMGLMPEALAAVIGHLFDSLGYEALVCGYFEGNVRSQRVQEKCGFSRIKRVSCATKLGEIKEEWLSVIYRK